MFQFYRMHGAHPPAHPQRVGRHQRVDVRFDERTGVELGRLQLLGEADFVRNVLRDEEKADRLAAVIPARGEHHPGGDAAAVLSQAIDHALPAPGAERLVPHALRQPARHILRRVQHVGARLPDHFFRFVAVHAARTLVPEDDGAVQVIADDGVLGGSLQERRHEFDRVRGLAHVRRIEQLHRHETSSPGTRPSNRSISPLAGRGRGPDTKADESRSAFQARREARAGRLQRRGRSSLFCHE